MTAADGPTLDQPSPGRRPTLRDVAARAEVSFKTVSRVVNGEGGVSPALALRVQTAVDELGFRPNYGARTLRRADGRTASIGLLLEDVSNPFSAAIQRAAEDVADRRGVVVLSASLDEDLEREKRLTTLFGGRGVDGLMIAPAGADQSHLSAELDAGTQIVCIDRLPTGLDVDAVASTNAAGAEAAVRHLVEHGHRRIAFLGDRPTIQTAHQRFLGYQAALRAGGLLPTAELAVHDLRSSAQAERAVIKLLAVNDPPTALFSAQNLVSAGAVRALRSAGRQDEIALIGFDDVPLADLVSPGLTVIAQDPMEIGRRAADLLFRRIDGDRSPAELHLVATVLLPRGSGEIGPSR